MAREAVGVIGKFKWGKKGRMPNRKFEEKTKFFIESFGLPKMQAMLFSILTIIDDPCEETSILSKAVQSGKLGSGGGELPSVLKKFLTHVKSKFT